MYGKRKAFQPEGALCPLVLIGWSQILEGPFRISEGPFFACRFEDYWLWFQAGGSSLRRCLIKKSLRLRSP